VRARFAHLTNEALIRARWPASVPLAAVGVAGGRTASPERPGRLLRRLGLLWLGAAAIGAVLGRAGAPVPGHRAILFSPFPAAVGLGVVVVGLVAWLGGTRARLPRAGWIAGALIGLSVIGLAIPGTLFFHRSIGPRRSAVWQQLHGAAALVERLPRDRPVVFVVQPDGPATAAAPKLERNVIRATMPAEAVTRTFVYVGGLANLRAGEPTLAPAGASWKAAYDRASLAMWAESGPALREGAVVLMVRSYDPVGFAAASAEAPDRVLAAGLFVERGPPTPLGGVAPDPPFTLLAAAAWAAGAFLLLLIVGWGFARAALRRMGATSLEVACTAPAIGTAAIVLAGFVAALVGFDPAGPAGLALILALAAAGQALRVRPAAAPR
jgi:hypothetical protein